MARETTEKARKAAKAKTKENTRNTAEKKENTRSTAEKKEKTRNTAKRKAAAKKETAGLPGFMPEEAEEIRAGRDGAEETAAAETAMPEEAAAETAMSEEAEAAAETAAPAAKAPARKPRRSAAKAVALEEELELEPAPEGGFSDKNEFGKRGPLLPTYERVSRIILDLWAKHGRFPKSPIVVKTAKGSPRVCMKHYNRIYQEYAEEGRESMALREKVDRQSETIAKLEAELAALNDRMDATERQLRAYRADSGKRLSLASGNMLSLFLMPWPGGERERLCREMIAELPRLAGFEDAPDEEERAKAAQRLRVLEKDGEELGRAVEILREAAEQDNLPELLRRQDARALARAVCAFCWFTPKKTEREALLRGLLDAGDGDPAGKREEFVRRVALDLCRPLWAVCRESDRDELAAFAGRLPETAALLNGRVIEALGFLLERDECREAMLPLRPAMMLWELARAGNAEGIDRLFRYGDFAGEIRAAADNAEQLGLLVDMGRPAALLRILEWDLGDSPDHEPAISPATADAALRRIFAGVTPRDAKTQTALADCIAALIRHGAELDDDMRGRLAAGRDQEGGTLVPTQEANRILALDAIQRILKEGGMSPDDPLFRLGLSYGPLIDLFTYGLPPEYNSAETLRRTLESALARLRKKNKLNL